MVTDPNESMSALPQLVFMGTADLAATVLRRLVADPRWQVILAVSQPDRPKGRDLALQLTPVKQAALELGIPMDQPTKARDPEFIERLRTLAPDLMVVAAYGQLLPQTLLDIPRHGCLNVHTSLLPAYRGAAPIQWALADGLNETGVTLMRMEAGLDTGPIVTTATTPILNEDTGQSLHDRLADLGGELLVRSLPDYLAGYLEPRTQPLDGVSLARKITKEDGRLVWERPAVELWRRLRAFTPWPGAFCHAEGGGKTRLVKVHAASLSEGSGRPGERLDYGKGRLVVACGRGALELLTLQPEGGRRMDAAAFLAGHPLERFT
jgi:methionyl-tRNA formyltransferase